MEWTDQEWKRTNATALPWCGGTGRWAKEIDILRTILWQDMREAASPSFFNPAEAVVVLDYIKQLVKEGVQPRNIGVITPYRYYWMDHFDV